MSTHTIKQIRRLQNSPSGNPRWKVVLDNGLAAYTEADSDLGLRIDTDWVGQAMMLDFEQRGTVNVLTRIEPADDLSQDTVIDPTEGDD